MEEYNYKEMAFVDSIFDKVIPLFRQGYFINAKGKITRNDVGGIYDTPWITYNVNREEQNCAKLHEMIFDTFNVIPKRCMECYKVVVRPRNVLELFKLSDLQKTMNVPCKAGIETRAYTPALYGGYFYCKGKENGLKRLEQVRALMDKHLGEGVDVYLKRACTEYELTFGDSDKWELDPMADFYEKWIDKHMDKKIFGTSHDYPSYVRLRTKVKWVRSACEHGDMTYKQFPGAEDLIAEPIKYERG